MQELNGIKISEKAIDEIFETLNHQSDVIIALYRLAYPNFDEIAKIDGWPEVSNYTWRYIARKFIQFDKEHHPDVLAGGLWMNSGFSVGEGLPDFTIRQAPYA